MFSLSNKNFCIFLRTQVTSSDHNNEHMNKVKTIPTYRYVYEVSHTQQFLKIKIQRWIHPLRQTTLVNIVWAIRRKTNALAVLLQVYHSFIHSIGMCRIQRFLPFSGASSIPLCYVLFPATLPLQLFFHPFSPHLATYFLVCLSILLFPNSYIILFWEFYFLPFSVHVQTNVTYLTLLSLLQQVF